MSMVMDSSKIYHVSKRDELRMFSWTYYELEIKMNEFESSTLSFMSCGNLRYFSQASTEVIATKQSKDFSRILYFGQY